MFVNLQINYIPQKLFDEIYANFKEDCGIDSNTLGGFYMLKCDSKVNFDF